MATVGDRPQNPYSEHLQLLLNRARARHREDPTQPPEPAPDTEVQGRELRARIIRRIEKTQDLPALPMVVRELQRVLSDHSADARKIAAVIELDPALAAQVLRLANSAMFGSKREIASVDRAVVLLGTREIWNLALTATVSRLFSSPPDRLFDAQKFWEHSLTVAMSCRLIAKSLSEMGKAIEPEAFLAGLLHDIGAIVIAEYFASDYERVWHLSQETGMSFPEAELTVMGVTHGDIGERLLRQWNIPDRIASAVRHHHNPDHSDKLAYVIHLGDEISRGLGFVSDVKKGSRLDPSVWTALGLSDRVIETIAYRVLVDFDATRSVLLGIHER